MTPYNTAFGKHRVKVAESKCKNFSFYYVVTYTAGTLHLHPEPQLSQIRTQGMG